MKNKVEPRILAGFMELLPDEQILFNKYLQIIRETYEEFGFVPLESPMVEYSDVLLAKIGEDTKKEIYRFNRGEDDLSLRFDLTVPLARFVAMNAQRLNFPFRRYQVGKVFRGERPQKGRFREFYQCDIDVIGNGKLGLINDAEIPAVIYRLFSKLNFGDFVIRISNRKVLTGLVESFGYKDKTDDVLRIVDKLEKIGKDSVVEELVKVGLDLGGANKVIDFVKIFGTNTEIVDQLRKMGISNESFEQGVNELEEVIKRAYEFGVPEKNLKLDLAIARGLSYYTGTVYETVLLDERISGSVCSGGRYDDLAESYTDVSYPGVGISIGLSRLFSQLLASGIIATESNTPAKVMVITLDDDLKFALEVANELRTNGIKTEVYIEDDKFKKKLSYANKVGVPFVAIIGEDEIKLKKVTLKNMKTGEQEMMSVEEVIKKLK
ncbi:histidine--tRNA ligase [Candidatus Collierbacteria bacterium RIFOXYD1_FULL_40_9]|uniref:Histidine--tRNA ligase n=1 Tax=Candidatus Collierbacteria bacterium RIFOXYD1_FULL_40_9 TaxID=1817731 RepID=A0A1F5FP05_9BACT|nr:MAG: histidine--tRNA ligase [Candidatus Collierbacteria bacterium RIFOXYD1_FULL_40_9]